MTRDICHSTAPWCRKMCLPFFKLFILLTTFSPQLQEDGILHLPRFSLAYLLTLSQTYIWRVLLQYHVSIKILLDMICLNLATY